jgi:hypothetical protein
MNSNIDAEAFSTIKNPTKDAFVRNLAEYEKKKQNKTSLPPAFSYRLVACFNIEFAKCIFSGTLSANNERVRLFNTRDY